MVTNNFTTSNKSGRSSLCHDLCGLLLLHLSSPPGFSVIVDLLLVNVRCCWHVMIEFQNYIIYDNL